MTANKSRIDERIDCQLLLTKPPKKNTDQESDGNNETKEVEEDEDIIWLQCSLLQQPRFLMN